MALKNIAIIAVALSLQVSGMEYCTPGCTSSGCKSSWIDDICYCCNFIIPWCHKGTKTDCCSIDPKCPMRALSDSSTSTALSTSTELSCTNVQKPVSIPAGQITFNNCDDSMGVGDLCLGDCPAGYAWNPDVIYSCDLNPTTKSPFLEFIDRSKGRAATAAESCVKIPQKDSTSGRSLSEQKPSKDDEPATVSLTFV